jgi:hypothetical protein
MEKYKQELKELIIEYQNIHDQFNTLEKQITQQMSIHNQLRNKLDKMREREKEIINNIEQETGEKMTGSKLSTLLL